MKLLKKIKFLCLIVLLGSIVYSNGTRVIENKDPFSALGIPDMNPRDMLKEFDEKENQETKNKKEAPQLKTIDDLPNFLQKSNLNEEDGIKILTRFLIQDDITLKKYGVVYDQSGFDGINRDETIAPIGTEERLTQRARSAANIWFREKYPKLTYDAYGAEAVLDEIIPNWRVYKVLMIGNKGESTFLKICLPLDESETALASDKDDSCGPKAEYVAKEKKKNEDYISKIKSNNFFKKKSGMVKLLPGEKMIIKSENNQQLVLDSHTIQKNSSQTAPSSSPNMNVPSFQGLNDMNDPLLLAWKQKHMTQVNGQMYQPMNNMGNQNANIGFQPLNNLNNLNSMNPGQVMNSMGNLKVNPSIPNYQFKQTENTINSFSPDNNNNMFQQLNDLKNQLNFMMSALKVKDDIIKQQGGPLNASLNNKQNNISQQFAPITPQNQNLIPVNNSNQFQQQPGMNQLNNQFIPQGSNNFLQQPQNIQNGNFLGVPMPQMR